MNIDRDIAEKVMGWKQTEKWSTLSHPEEPWYDPMVEYPQKTIRYAWHPSTDIRQAFEVVEKMRETGYWFEITMIGKESGSGYEIVVFNKNAKPHIHKLIHEVCTEYHENPAMVICLAALKAVENK